MTNKPTFGSNTSNFVFVNFVSHPRMSPYLGYVSDGEHRKFAYNRQF